MRVFVLSMLENEGNEDNVRRGGGKIVFIGPINYGVNGLWGFGLMNHTCYLACDTIQR
jgi:hypothetical protein